MELYLLDAERVSGEDERIVRTRFPERYARALRCANPADGRCLIAAGALLYRVLGADESVLEKTPGGKPFIPGGREFSISHSGGKCVLAVSKRPVGVDIEKLDESSLIAAPAALTQEELKWIEPSPLERFHILWTRKESVYKAIGGFSDPRQIAALEGREPEGIHVKSAVRNGFALSVCSYEEPGGLDLIIIK